MHQHAWISKLYLVEKKSQATYSKCQFKIGKKNTYMCLCITHESRKRSKRIINTEIQVLVKSTEGRGNVMKSEGTPRYPQS